MAGRFPYPVCASAIFLLVFPGEAVLYFSVMDTKLMIELFGYLGSALVVISMLMTSVVRLRVINMIGSCIFAIYALIIHSYPTAVMNVFLVGINLYNLFRLRKSDPQYQFVSELPDSAYLKRVLAQYADDIKTYFPSFHGQETRFDTAYLTICDLKPAGVLLGTKKENDTIDILIDYSTPAYRDLSLGTSLFEHLKQAGVKHLTISDPDAKHLSYLEKMGFRKDADCYVKDF